ncbi:hypothetical protein AH02_51 [Pseudomonas phage AH02]|nr:hypothetical protein AH02_51 [Pseudomonas phage AH02]
MTIKEANESFEVWREEQIASLVRTGHLEAAKAFEQLGSIHWMAWQSAWQASRAVVVIELPPLPEVPEDPVEAIDDSHMDAYHSAIGMRHACAKFIESAGLRVKS